MARKGANADIIQQFIVSKIIAGHRSTDIVNDVKAQYKLQARAAHRHLAYAKKAISANLANLDSYRPIIIARYEQQYRDCEQIEKTETKIRLQRDINDSMARLTGADQPQPKSVNIFQFFPVKDERGRVQVDIPAEYSVDAPETVQDGPGDDLDDGPIRMLVPGGAR
jgi:hypothetical protein